MDDTVATALSDTSNSDDNEHTGGVVYALRSRAQKTAHNIIKPCRHSNISESEKVTADTMDLGKNKCQSRYDNYPTVKAGEDISTDELFNDHSKRERERQVVFCVY